MPSMISTATNAPVAPTMRPRGRPDENERNHHRGLRQSVIGGVGAKRPMHDLDQPPRQWRQLVVAELPFAAIGQGLDQIERQVG
jgi:hypothetical protein